MPTSQHDKAKAIDAALSQLAVEIAADRQQYDHAAAVLIYSGIDQFRDHASEASKALLYDTLKEGFSASNK
tara:strand:- start:2427 stop:2639 length:213 start_codon:yes stop_codon:yes gene_type:complete